MDYIPVVACAQLEAIYNMSGQVAENVFHYEIPLASSPAILTQFAVDWLAEWNTVAKPYVPNDTSLISIKVTDLTTQFSPSIVYSTGLPLAGTRGVNMLPNNVTCVFTKRTANRGRSYRGRVYWPGLIEADVINNTITAGIVIAINGALNSLISITSSAQPWTMQVVSKRGAGEWRAAGIMTPVTGFTSDGVIDSQRKRLPGRGA